MKLSDIEKVCVKCGSSSTNRDKVKIHCNNCGHNEPVIQVNNDPFSI